MMTACLQVKMCIKPAFHATDSYAFVYDYYCNADQSFAGGVKGKKQKKRIYFFVMIK